jgi:hypothetical protein
MNSELEFVQIGKNWYKSVKAKMSSPNQKPSGAGRNPLFDQLLNSQGSFPSVFIRVHPWLTFHSDYSPCDSYDLPFRPAPAVEIMPASGPANGCSAPDAVR